MSSVRARRKSPLPSIALLRRMLDYDQKTGVLRWKVKPQLGIDAGAIAGSLGADGYITVRVKGSQVKAHRAAFAIVKGRWPKWHLDHRDNDKTNNRWRNLREATTSQNACNRQRANANNATGSLGVHCRADGHGFTARISIHLGTFKSFHAAVRARHRAEELLHGEFASSHKGKSQ